MTDHYYSLGAPLSNQSFSAELYQDQELFKTQTNAILLLEMGLLQSLSLSMFSSGLVLKILVVIFVIDH